MNVWESLGESLVQVHVQRLKNLESEIHGQQQKLTSFKELSMPVCASFPLLLFFFFPSDAPWLLDDGACIQGRFSSLSFRPTCQHLGK
jgi:hypothetical protein